MFSCLAALATVGFLVACGGGDEVSQDESLRITLEVITNTVETDTSADSGSGQSNFQKAKPGQRLSTGHGVKTFLNSEARVDIVILENLRVARTKPNTIWRLGRFSAGEDGIIELTQGKLFLLDEGAGQGIDVDTPAGTAGARGTWMSVSYSPGTGVAEVQCFRAVHASWRTVWASSFSPMSRKVR